VLFVCLFDCLDFPEELSKLSLIEQPSPLYCEKKADLWKRINESELEGADSDSGYCSPYHSHRFNLLPAAVNPSYLPVVNGPVMIVPYGLSQDDVQHHSHHVIINDCSSSWYCRQADNTVRSAGTRQHNSAAVMPDSAVQTVSLMFMHMHYVRWPARGQLEGGVPGSMEIGDVYTLHTKSDV